MKHKTLKPVRHRIEDQISELTGLLMDGSVWKKSWVALKDETTDDDGRRLAFLAIQCRNDREELFCFDIEFIINDALGKEDYLLDITMYRTEDCLPGKEFNYANSKHLLYDVKYDNLTELIRTLNQMTSDGHSYDEVFSWLLEMEPYNRERYNRNDVVITSEDE